MTSVLITLSIIPHLMICGIPSTDRLASYASQHAQVSRKVGGVSGGVFEHVSWLMGLVPLSRAIYLDRRLADDMFNKIGYLISRVDEEIAKMDRMGALRMGDDLGYKRGTFIAPQLVRAHITTGVAWILATSRALQADKCEYQH